VASITKPMFVFTSATCVFVSALVAQAETGVLERKLDSGEYSIAGPSDTCPADGHPTCAHPTATESPEGPGWVKMDINLILCTRDSLCHSDFRVSGDRREVSQ
jgi:hypothetical protein